MNSVSACLFAACLAAGCGGAGTSGSPDLGGGGGDMGTASGERTLDSCGGSVAAGVPEFYRTYFACSTITMGATGVVIRTDNLPPHKSYYYGEGSPNYAPFDFSRGSMYRANPNRLAARPFSIEIPDAPMPRGLTITAAMVDKMARTSPNEYAGGSVGVALDGVALYNAVAAPGDNIDQEAYTFDNYEAHPSPDSSYHYHSATPGPLEVLTKRGLSASAVAGSASPEVYGIMCDGTLVLGCTELDGAAIPTTGPMVYDAQNGHVHDIKDKAGTTHFTARYHTHICAAKLPAFRYTPEIQYHATCRVTRL
jgi:hypothetical protein